MSTVTPPTPVEGGWTCPACTMVNPRGALKCSVCNTPKTKPVSNKVVTSQVYHSQPKRVRRAAKDMGLKVQPTEEKEKKEEKVEEKKEKVEEKEEEKEEKPTEKKAQTEELIDLSNHDGESEILKNDTIRITVMKKQYGIMELHYLQID